MAKCTQFLGLMSTETLQQQNTQGFPLKKTVDHLNSSHPEGVSFFRNMIQIQMRNTKRKTKCLVCSKVPLGMPLDHLKPSRPGGGRCTTRLRFSLSDYSYQSWSSLAISAKKISRDMFKTSIYVFKHVSWKGITRQQFLCSFKILVQGTHY